MVKSRRNRSQTKQRQKKQAKVYEFNYYNVFGYDEPPLFQWNHGTNKRIVINQGGTSSGKTYSLLQVLFFLAFNNDGSIITIVGQDIPNLKSGALRDWQRIVSESGFVSAYIDNYNKSERIYTFENGSQFEFKSYSDEQDAKSGKRDYLFINEGNGISYPVYNQLAMRTNKQIFIDYNPTTSFWVHEHLLGEENTVRFISNFSHNPFADPNIVEHVRGYKERDPESWRVYGMGLTGNIKGLVFRNVNFIQDLPKNLKKRCYGLDFGFTNDPTALCEIGELHGEIYGRELIYRLAMTNQDISREMDRLGISRNDQIFADSAEPKSIAELRAEGWNVTGATKGTDSVKHGIDLMKQYNWNITSDSKNWKKEQANYKWQEKDGISLNKPVDNFNHLWDASRYAFAMKWGHIMKRAPRML